MKKIFIATQVIFILSACTGKKESNGPTISKTTEKNTIMETDIKKNIEETLYAYENALNTSSTEKVLPLYTQNGIFMPQGANSAEGQEQLKKAYDFVFKTLQLNVKFTIEEITLINENYAIARTLSKGTQQINTERRITPEENRELFVMENENGKWKIARYMFNKMK